MPEPITARCCVICGTAGQPYQSLVPQGFEGEAMLCLGCLNSPAGLAWRAAKRSADPAYDRFLTLSTVGRPIECPQCRHPLRASPKGRGMASGSWRVACLNCHRQRDIGTPFDALQRLEEDFLRGRGLEQIDPRVAAIARAYDSQVNAVPCSCGGRFSLAAKPRCPRCTVVAFDSYFHDVYEI